MRPEPASTADMQAIAEVALAVLAGERGAGLARQRRLRPGRERRPPRGRGNDAGVDQRPLAHDQAASHRAAGSPPQTPSKARPPRCSRCGSGRASSRPESPRPARSRRTGGNDTRSISSASSPDRTGRRGWRDTAPSASPARRRACVPSSRPRVTCERGAYLTPDAAVILMHCIRSFETPASPLLRMRVVEFGRFAV